MLADKMPLQSPGFTPPETLRDPVWREASELSMHKREGSESLTPLIPSVIVGALKPVPGFEVESVTLWPF